METVRKKTDQQAVGLSKAVLSRDTTTGRPGLAPPGTKATIEEEEAYARKMQQRNPILLFLEGTFAALKVFAIYLITLDTIVSCSACVLITMYWYLYSVSKECVCLVRCMMIRGLHRTLFVH